MNSTSSIALSGMQAAQTRLQSSAHNVANLGTEGFRRQEVRQSPQAGGGVSAEVVRTSAPDSALVQDMLDQLQAKNALLANLAVFKTQDKLAGALLDMKA